MELNIWKKSTMYFYDSHKTTSLTPILKDISMQAYETQQGWYSLAQHQRKVPDFVWNAAKDKGSVFITTYQTLLYDYLTDKAST